jgi:small subunit ribosomal protein S8
MSISDPIGDMLARIKNAIAVGKKSVEVPFSKIKRDVAKVLVEKGYLENVEKVKSNLILHISFKDGRPVLTGAKRVSKPGLRVYTKYKDIPIVKEGFGISILSTSKGVMSGDEARKLKLGGEILCFIW